MEHTSLGGYSILGQLGRGATGTVFRAKDPNVEREVAIKVLLPALPREVRERLMREARSAERLNHTNIVTLFAVGQQDNVAYIAMELVEGRSLQHMMRAPERITFDKAAQIAAQLAEALDYAHRLGIIHGDVKPASVLVDAAGRAKLTDFGITTSVSATNAQTNAASGSQRYLSPEQVLGQPLDARSDIFALGAVLYEMLARHAPVDRAAGKPYQPLRELDDTIPIALERIVDKALTRNADGRYQRPAEMAADLRGWRPRAPAASALPALDDILGDLDAFSEKLDTEAKALVHKTEEEARHKKAEEERRTTAAAQHGAMATPSQAGDATAPPASPPARKARALDMLRSAPSAAPAENPAVVRRRNVADLNQAMRAWEKYFAEFMHEVAVRCPAVASPYSLRFFGTLPRVTLSHGWTDSRPRSIEGEDCMSYVVLRYRVNPESPAKLMLFRDDVVPCETYLTGLQAVFEVAATAKNDFGQVMKSEFTMTGGPACEIRIQADYDAFTVGLDMINVRQIGRRSCRIPTAEFAGLADDLARYLLGADDDFEKQLNPAK